MLGPGQRHIEHPHDVKARQAVLGFSLSVQQGAYHTLNGLESAVIFAGIRQNDNRKFQPFGLVNGQKRNTSSGKGVLRILIFGFPRWNKL